MQLSLQLSKLQGTTSYFDGNMGRVGVKSDTVTLLKVLNSKEKGLKNSQVQKSLFLVMSACKIESFESSKSSNWL